MASPRPMPPATKTGTSFRCGNTSWASTAVDTRSTDKSIDIHLNSPDDAKLQWMVGATVLRHFVVSARYDAIPKVRGVDLSAFSASTAVKIF